MNVNTDKQIGQIFRNKREEKNITQTELGRMIGIGKSMMHYFEVGERSMSVRQFFCLCDKLDVDPTSIMRVVNYK